MTSAFVKDLRYALRRLIRAPGFTAVAIAILALGIGANTAIFSMVNAVLLQPLPYGSGERMVVIRQQLLASSVDSIPFSVLEVSDYRDQNQTLDAVVEYHSMWFTLLGREEPQRVQTGVVSANYFDVFGIKPLLGRSLQPGDEAPGAEAVLILSHGFWQRDLGGDPDAVGRTFEMNDRIHTVVGVLPPWPQYPDEIDVYMATSACPFRSSEDTKAERNARMLQVFGRLKPGVTIEEARTDLGLIAQRLIAEHPEIYSMDDGYGVGVVALEDELVGDAAPWLWLLLGTVALVLLITCTNLANLVFARQVRRDREMAVRAVMGADRGGLIRHFLTESTLLALLGGLVGVVLASGVLDLLIAFAGRFTVRAEEATIDAAVLFFAIAVSILTGVAVGCLPALSLSRNPVDALREGSGRSTGGVVLKRVRNSLIVVELAISFVLLVGAGLMLRSLSALRQVDSGFDSERVLTMQIGLNWNRYNNEDAYRRFFTTLLDSVEALPGVVSSAVSFTFPLDQETDVSDNFEIEGNVIPEGQPRPRAGVRVASPDYFATVGIPLLNGRLFDHTDHAEAPGVVLVNRALARRYWESEDPIGKQVSVDKGQTWKTIVGVVGDVKHHGPASDAAEELYFPFLQRPVRQMSLLTRTAGDPVAMSRPIREKVYEIDPNQPVAKIRTLDEMVANSLASPRLTTALLALFAGLALAIAAAGLGGLIAFSVSQETREIGLRMALGARRREVLWAILRRISILVALGLALGLAGSFLLTRWISSLLYGVRPGDLVTFVSTTLLLMAVAAVACLAPARRATLIDPATALRYD